MVIGASRGTTVAGAAAGAARPATWIPAAVTAATGAPPPFSQRLQTMFEPFFPGRMLMMLLMLLMLMLMMMSMRLMIMMMMMMMMMMRAMMSRAWMQRYSCAGHGYSHGLRLPPMLGAHCPTCARNQ